MISVEGTGVARRGWIQMGQRFIEVGFAFVPEAEPGDVVVAHSGQAVRRSECLDVVDGLAGDGEAEALVDEGRSGVAHLIDLEGGAI